MLVKAYIFHEDGTVTDTTNVSEKHPVQRRLEQQIEELKSLLALPADELEIVEILNGKTVEDIQNEIVEYALKTLDVACKITKFNMTPIEDRPAVQVVA